MPQLSPATARLLACAAASLLVLPLAGCGSSPPAGADSTPTTTTTQPSPPGAGRPPVTIGDKNYTEQFVLGELYSQALQAQGFTVSLNRNIGPTQVTLQALHNGQLAMYPEYLNVWNSSVAGYQQTFTTRRSAFRAAQRYALAHGMELLNPTPFSDTDAIGVTVSFAQRNHLHAIGDLRRVAASLTFGAPPQFAQEPSGLPALEAAYGFVPAAVKSLEIGQQYEALDQGVVQAADVASTDGELTSGNYSLLDDPKGVLGVGNVVPVVSAQALYAEGPAFAQIINRVSSDLTLQAMRALNAAVDVAGQDPATVAKRFLIDHGLVPATATS